jgi:hypothetical protein
MPDEARLRDQGPAAIRSGKTVLPPTDRTCGGPVVGSMCPVCGLPVTKDQLELEMLTEGHLPLSDGILRSGRSCVVCQRKIRSSEVEREVQGAGVFHEPCYEVWWEDSSTRRVVGK